ncbi:hypothetical protein G6F46_000233 [Rhizopus delemar]|nr:hypothetical protein G6F55_005476 [Rhizopus delemar]KAG1554330.1 hypothetical protein G6F51_000004 [Rhizopus arrhizus]KAG1505607.1 hypothetical protein G6F54_000186 [Rhizopus delemar]KAG1518202.1 hypothetical protein G6F53_000775 [Rhizopus delemar]KAG1524464.1 hypothetical protein G6F52_004172 [Rhizopus delemar]
MTPSVIQIARSFNYFYLAELCKLTVDELLGKVADPLLKCIDYDQWRMALPAPYKMENHADLELEPLNGNEWFFMSSASPEARTIKTEKQYMKPSRNTRMSIEEQGKKQYRPITTTTIQLSTILYQWLSTDISEYQPTSTMFQTLKSVEKMKRQQQAIIETRQRQIAFTAPTKVTRLMKGAMRTDRKSSASTSSHSPASDTSFPPSPPVCSDKRKKGAYFHSNKKSRLLPIAQEKRPVLPLPSQQHENSEHNLHLLASQATQMRGLPISPSLSPSSPPTPFLLQPIGKHAKQPPLRLPSIRSMLSELPIQIGRNMDYCA